MATKRTGGGGKKGISLTVKAAWIVGAFTVVSGACATLLSWFLSKSAAEHAIASAVPAPDPKQVQDVQSVPAARSHGFVVHHDSRIVDYRLSKIVPAGTKEKLSPVTMTRYLSLAVADADQASLELDFGTTGLDI